MFVLTDVICRVVVKSAVQAKVGKIFHYFIRWTKISNLYMYTTEAHGVRVTVLRLEPYLPFGKQQ